VSDKGFCVSEPDCQGGTATACFARQGGQPAKPGDVIPPVIAKPPAPRGGVFMTRAIDSYLPRCRWHRLRVDADLPAGTSIRVAVATSEMTEDGKAIGDPFAADYAGDGLFHRTDWHRVTGTDFLIDQPPGRYLFVALQLTGTGPTSPVVRQVRLDFPRATSLDRLPEGYREDPEAEDFTERFLALFDASLEDLDRSVERFPALLDPALTPESVLPWLGSFLGLEFDPSWPPELRRRLLQLETGLARKRGTRAGLAGALSAVFGLDE